MNLPRISDTFKIKKNILSKLKILDSYTMQDIELFFDIEKMGNSISFPYKGKEMLNKFAKKLLKESLKTTKYKEIKSFGLGFSKNLKDGNGPKKNL